MRKVKYLIILFALLSIPNIAKADCSTSNIVRLKKIASNVTTTYDYSENFNTDGFGNVIFTATISNVHPEIFIRDFEFTYLGDGVDLVTNENNQVIIPNIGQGTKNYYGIYSRATGDCEETMLLSFFINPPNYNRYYTSPLCSEYPEYTYCQKWIKNSFSSYSEFETSFQKYIDSLKEGEEDQVDDNPDDRYETFIEILDFLAKYSIPIFGGISLVSIILIIYFKGKDDFKLNKKSR